jgi:cytochrome c2
MAYRIPRAIGIALFLSLILALPALAGGWAVITLDEWPGQVDPSKPLKIGFVVRQHGISPMEDLEPTITFRNPDTGDRFTAHAKPEGDTGHYTAVFSFPSTGTWNWSIEAFTMEQPMPPLNVSAGEPLVTERERNLPASLWLVVILSSVTAAAGGLIFSFRRRNRWGFALAVAGLVVGATGLVTLMNQSASAQGQAASPSASTAQQQLGEKLFIAKGCGTCHNNGRVTNDGNILIGMGPDMTKYQANPDYLRSWLKDPLSIKPNTKMPDLGLKKDEIEALIVFLNANRAE